VTRRSFCRSLTVLAALLSWTFSAAAEDAGLAAPYLQLGAGVRALGMGAFTGIADDSSAAYWNPAGLALLRQYEFNSEAALMSLGRSNNYLGYTHLLKNNGAVALTWINYSAGSDLEARQGNTLSPDSTFADNENALYLSWGKALNKEWLLGLSLKALFQSLFDQSAFGLGGDLGLLYENSQGWTAGLMLQDVYSYMNWAQSGTNDTLPTNVRLGGSILLLDSKALLVGMDLGFYHLQDFRWGAGVEYLVTPYFALRGGFQNGLPLAGFGFDFPFTGTQSEFDYAVGFDNIDPTGPIHRFALRVRFDKWPGLD